MGIAEAHMRQAGQGRLHPACSVAEWVADCMLIICGATGCHLGAALLVPMPCKLCCCSFKALCAGALPHLPIRSRCCAASNRSAIIMWSWGSTWRQTGSRGTRVSVQVQGVWVGGRGRWRAGGLLVKLFQQGLQP